MTLSFAVASEFLPQHSGNIGDQMKDIFTNVLCLTQWPSVTDMCLGTSRQVLVLKEPEFESQYLLYDGCNQLYAS